MSPVQWPSSREYVEAIQNPALSFQDPDLKTSTPAVDRLGMPFVTSGQFAYVFKMNSGNGGKAQAVRCFRGAVGDREERYQRINDHLNKISAPYFASFEFDPQGILVTGRRYPIQVMEWIDGFPLDVYLPNVLGRKDVLKFLADLWLKALTSLRDGGMAHGDLQHGNVIVGDSNSLSLRLVDLDGMFVPAMSGWKSAELGHRHYQHPKREPNYFDASLDNFSGLVIYLSLLSLMELPALWADFHDENLIFTKADFENPHSSKLFAKIKALGSDHKRLAEALEKACGEDPARCPSALDLVTALPSKLPEWMLDVPRVQVQQQTREVKSGSVTPDLPGSATPASPVGGTKFSPTSQTTQAGGISSHPPSAQPVPGVQTRPSVSHSDLTGASARHAVSYAFIGVFLVCLWLPILQGLFVGMGAQPTVAAWLSVLTFLAVCAGMGYRKAKTEATQPARPAPSVVPSPSSPVRPIPRPVTASLPGARGAYTSQASLVGSKIRLIYHEPSCKWARKISFRNRVQFSSVTAAKAAGYRPCGVCSP